MSTLAAYSASQPKVLSRVLKDEIKPSFTFASRTLLAGSGAARDILLGTVMGRQLFGAPVGAATGGNTGNGGLGSIALKSKAKLGVYTLTCIATAANGGRFAVIDPDGYALADALVGVAYVSPQIGFTIGDGAADFVVGDSFTITVPVGSLKVIQLNMTAVDGSQRADSVAANNVSAPDGVDVPLRVIAYGALVSASELVWPAGINDAQKAAAFSELAVNRILTLASA